MPETQTLAPDDSDRLAARLRGFGPVGVVAILVVVLGGNLSVAGFMVPLGALLALAWTRLSRTPLGELGLAAPRNWWLSVLLGIALGITLKLAMKALVMPLLGADPINRAYSYLAGNPDLIVPTLWTMLIVGLAEETVFRGFLFERLGKLFGRSARARAAIVLITSAVFGAAHYGDQGLSGVQNAAIVGLVLGSTYAVTRNLWLPIVAHSAFDLTAYAMIYWQLESRIAHFVFS